MVLTNLASIVLPAVRDATDPCTSRMAKQSEYRSGSTWAPLAGRTLQPTQPGEGEKRGVGILSVSIGFLSFLLRTFFFVLFCILSFFVCFCQFFLPPRTRCLEKIPQREAAIGTLGVQYHYT